MRRRSLLWRFAPALFAVLSLGGPAWADDPPKKNTVYVRPEDMAAAEAARKKAAEGRKLLVAKKLREGVQMVDEALGELERTTGPDSDFSTSNRKVVIAIYQQLNEPEKIKAVEARAEAARKKWAPPPPRFQNENTGKAMVKMTLGLEALKNNDFAKAAELLEQALPDVEKSDASEKMYLMIAGVLASLYDHSQQFAKGEALRKSVIAKMEKSLGDSVEVAEQYEFFATHYMMRADTQKALAAQKRCVEITRKQLPASAPLVDRLITLSSLQTNTGDGKSGEATLREAMGIVRVLRPLDPLRMVRVAHALATVLDGQFKNAEGDQIASAACDIANTANLPDVLEEAEPDCIRTALAKKDTKTAGILATKRFARVEKRYGAKAGLYAAAAHELAQVRWAEGKKDEATALAKKAADAQEVQLVRLLEVSGDAEKRAHLSLVSSQAYDLLSMGGNGIDGGSAQTRLALETILRRKGRSLDASADAARVVRLFDKPADKALAKRQLDLRRQIAALGLRGSGGDLPGVDPAALLAKLEAEHDEIGNKLAAASPLYRAQARPVTIEAVQATIPDDSALVEYVYYHARDTSSPVFATKEVRFVAFVLHKTGDPVAVDLGDGLPIGRGVNELRKALSDQGDVLPHAKRVHELVVAPLKKHLRPTDKRLIVSPDDDLNLVPFGALVDDRGQFVVQDYEVAYVTSGRDLLRIAAANEQRSSTSKPVVLGDPAFDGSVGSSSSSAKGMRAGDLDNARFPPLPGTAVETKAIADLLAASAFTQADATKAHLTGVASPVVLHVATHGFFLKRERDPAAKGTRSLEYDPGKPVVLPPRSENPLVRSGLALAGANQKTSADGLLTALEASSMNLDGTKLVVLSACETGVGQTEVGDGVYGLRRALVVAGSESQLMSLWKVDDEATRDLMIAFYRDLKSGTGRSAALRKVQLAMLSKKETQHPYFWAAFIPSGAWTPMSFDVQAAPSVASMPSATSSAPPPKDRPSPSPHREEPRRRSSATVFFGFNYMATTNLRD
ncbi:MAG TPA: CHAT domain-containing protein, partial [Labilithrix sp.]|nr:CHAT domain-containing protein [Labilithrix sp.]